MECLALRKDWVNDKGLKITQYLVANGQNMGRWTLHFGVHCLADTYDTKEYLKAVKQDNQIIETYKIEKEQ